MDVSGSIAANPRKDEYTFDFFENLLVQFEADTQAIGCKIEIGLIVGKFVKISPY